MKVHENPNGRVVAACDASLMGRSFSEGNAVLDLEGYGSFYKGSKVGGREVLEQLKNFSSLNLVGKDAVALAIGAGLLKKEQVGRIAGVPHAQVYRI